MASVGGGGTPCVICEKTCYPAEAMSFYKKIYHQECFKCSLCSKKVAKASDMSQYEEKLFCTHCFTKEGYAQKQKQVKWTKKESTGSAVASKYGGGGSKCVVCDKTAYPAEAVSFEKRIYHPDCMKCTNCEKKCAASSVQSFEEKLFCKQCFTSGGYAQKQRNVKWQPKASSGGSAIASKFGGGGTKCTACDKTVFQAEQLTFEKKPYHAECMKCTTCSKKLKPAGAASFEDALFCTKCFETGGYAQKQRNVKWTAKEGSSSATSSKFGGGGNKCKSCDKTVYPAETVSFEKQFFHAECFTCKECNLKLKVSTAEGYHIPDGDRKGDIDVYCKQCFQSKNLHRA